MMNRTQLAAEIRELHKATRASIAEYHAHPFAVCFGWLSDPDGSNERPCLNMRHPRDVLCRSCRKAAAVRRAAA